MARPRKVKDNMVVDYDEDTVAAPELTSEVTEEVALPASTMAEQLAGREALARVHANKPKVEAAE